MILQHIIRSSLHFNSSKLIMPMQGRATNEGLYLCGEAIGAKLNEISMPLFLRTKVSKRINHHEGTRNTCRTTNDEKRFTKFILFSSKH